MKSNGTRSTAATKSNSTRKPASAAGKKTSAGNTSTPATQKTRSKTRHGHGMSNEGTNTSYEEERD